VKLIYNDLYWPGSSNGLCYMLGKHIDRFIFIHVVGPRQERAQTPVLKNWSGYQTRDLWYAG